jgi:ubiquinone/menaquinone biosynthesis C-methylase UbiE
MQLIHEDKALNHWEVFYRGGALATGPVGADGLYDQEVRDAWEQFFAMLPDGARLLDIGTGNGVIPLIAARLAERDGKRWQIDATDLASIEPERYAKGFSPQDTIRFHGGVGNEKLPFDANRFAAASGQFALEYGDVSASLKEIYRVLASDGRAQFVVHHRESVLLENAAIELQDAKLVLRRVKLYDKLENLLTLKAQTTPATVQLAADDVIAAIRELKAVYAERAALQPGAVRTLMVAIDAAQKLLKLRQSFAPGEAGKEARRAGSEMEAAHARLQDLVTHALDASGFDALKSTATAVGFAIDRAEPLFHARDNLIGWLLTLRKSA